MKRAKHNKKQKTWMYRMCLREGYYRADKDGWCAVSECVCLRDRERERE